MIKINMDRGFTMVEVLVGILLNTIFLVSISNTLVMAAHFKVQAKRQAQAMFWIQEDREQIRALAADVTVVQYQPSQCTTYGNYLKTRLGQLNYLDTSTNTSLQPTKLLVNKSHKLNRVYTVDAANPSILLINYQVIDTESNKIIEQYNTQVQASAINSCVPN